MTDANIIHFAAARCQSSFMLSRFDFISSSSKIMRVYSSTMFY